MVSNGQLAQTVRDSQPCQRVVVGTRDYYSIIIFNMIYSRIPAHFLRSKCEADRFPLRAHLGSDLLDVWVTGSYMYSLAFKPRKQTCGKLGNINILC